MPSARRTIAAAAASCLAALFLAACTGTSHRPPVTPPVTSATPAPRLTHPLPSGFSAPGSTAFPSTSVLQVAPATDLNPAALHRGPFPVSQVKGVAQAIVNQAVPTLTRPLLVSVSAYHAGQTVTVAAGDLGSAPHDVLFILQGPGLRAQRLVHASNGASAGTVTLPATLAQGIWALAAEDLSGVHAQGTKRPTGTVLLDLTIFTIH